MPIYRIIPTLATTYLRDLNRTMCQCSFGHLGSSKLTAINRNKVMCDFRILTLSFYNFTCESSYVSLERAVCMFISTHTHPIASASGHVVFPMYAVLLL